MSEPTGARRYGVGGGDAYYDAVRYGGYEGTREQFGKDQAEFAQNAAAVAEAKETVERDTEEVRNTKNAFENTTVPEAIRALEQESEDQILAITQKGEEVSQQVETVGTEQKDAVANEGRSRIQAIEQAGTTQVQNVNDAGTTQVRNVNQAGEDQVDAVEQAGADQVQAVTDEGNTQVRAVTDEGGIQVQRVQDKGDEVLNSIPSDYIELTEDVDNLKESLNNFSDIFNILSTGVKETGDIIFTSDDVNVGDVIYYNITASGVAGVAYIGFYDSSNVRLAYYGKGSSTSTVLNYSGTAEIPSGFSYCQVFTNNNLTLDIGYIFNGKPYFEEINNLNNIVDSPFKSPVPNVMKGIIGFKFLYVPFTNAQYKVTNIYYKDAFYFYMPVQVLRNGSWVAYDAIEIPLADAPTENAVTILTSKYGYFKVAFIPSMMTTGRATGVNYLIKNTAIDPFQIDLQSQVTEIKAALPIFGMGDYELKDNSAHIVTVDANGNGDYSTIEAAYAAITDSSFSNQYEVIIYPGTYEEYNLIPPPYTHTHGLFPGSVIVTSEGVSSTSPVFDQKNAPSKLSNMTIISGTGYCVHQDAGLNGVVLVNENLYCKKIYDTPVPNFTWQQKTNPAIVGDGAQYNGAKFIWRSCTFENGEVACHSNSGVNDHANQHFILENCKLVNAWVWLGMVGSSLASRNSHCVAEFRNLYAPVGCPSVKFKYGQRVDDETNFIWQVIGGDNKNFSIIFDNSADTLAGEVWENVNTTEKTFVQITASVIRGQWITNNFAPCAENENVNNVFGVALADGSPGDTIPVWVGNAYRDGMLTDGEYGIGTGSTLSASTTTKIGRVKNKILHRYSM